MDLRYVWIVAKLTKRFESNSFRYQSHFKSDTIFKRHKMTRYVDCNKQALIHFLIHPYIHHSFFFLLIQLHLEFTTHFNWFFSACQSRWWCWPFNWIVNSNCDILSCNIFHFCCIKPLHSIPIWKFDLSFSFWKIFLGNFLRLSILIFFVNYFCLQNKLFMLIAISF